MRSDLPSIEQVVELLGLEEAPNSQHGDSFNVKCPFCGDTKYHMNIDVRKNTYNCVRCSDDHSGGGVLDLYSRAVFGERYVPGNGAKVLKALDEALGTGEVVELKKWQRKSVPIVERASDANLNLAYSTLLSFSEFSLSKEHYEKLKIRGLSDETIKRNRYKTIPLDCEWVNKPRYEKAIKAYNELNLDQEAKAYPKLAKLKKNQRIAGFVVASFLKKKNISMKGVPGFFRLKGYWMFKIEPGMLIPTRNEKGEIVCFQVRKDLGDIRYLAISSKGLPLGVSEKITRTHFPLANCKQSIVCITEGPLKADVALELMKCQNAYFIAIQGVNNTAELPEIFKTLVLQGVTTVYDAFDADKLTNPHVKNAVSKICKLAKSAGLKVKHLYWDEEYASKLLNKAISLQDKLPCESHFKIDGRKSIFSNLDSCLMFLKKQGIDIYNMLNGNGNKDNWNDATKGIDDYLKYMSDAEK